MWRLGMLIAVIVVMSTGGCGAEHLVGVDAGSPRACDAVRGSAIDVANEPAWRSGQYRDWSDRNGCLVRIDVLTDRPGPDHCGYGSARVIVTGRRVGDQFTTAMDSVEYVRDPDGVFDVPKLTEGLMLDAALPADATDAGFRQAEVELWSVPGDTDFIYLKDGDRIERWPAGETPGCS